MEAMIFLAVARGLIRFVPFRYWNGKLGALSGGDSVANIEVDSAKLAIAKTIGQCVRRSASHAPFQAVCLPQALAARWMLKRRDIPNQLFIGARPKQDSRMIDLHAWLKVGDMVLTGRYEHAQFKPFESSSLDPS